MVHDTSTCLSLPEKAEIEDIENSSLFTIFFLNCLKKDTCILPGLKKCIDKHSPDNIIGSKRIDKHTNKNNCVSKILILTRITLFY